MILFDEIERFNELTETDNAFSFSVKDYMILIKRYRFLGLSDEEINKKIYDIYFGANGAKIKKAFKNCRNKTYKPVEEIVIYKEELYIIQQQLDYELQKFMFIMLCLCKFQNNFNKNYLYVTMNSNISVMKIFKTSCVKSSKKDKLGILYPLKKQGLVKCDNGEIQLLYYREIGTPTMKFVPYNDMIYEYRSYIGDRVIRCEYCNKWIYKRGNKTKYCDSCAKIISNKQHAEIMREKRNVTK